MYTFELKVMCILFLEIIIFPPFFFADILEDFNTFRMVHSRRSNSFYFGWARALTAEVHDFPGFPGRCEKKPWGGAGAKG